VSRLYSEKAYVLEDAIFHGLVFAILGSILSMLMFGMLSEALSVYRVGFSEFGHHAFAYLRMGMISFVLAAFVIGPPMFIAGALVSVLSYGLENERGLMVFGGVATAAVVFIFGWIIGEPTNARFLVTWAGAGETVAGGLAGALMVRSTRALRIWRDRAAVQRAGQRT
jgi:hypothetical protein